MHGMENVKSCNVWCVSVPWTVYPTTVWQLKTVATEYGRITQASAKVPKFAFPLEYLVVCYIVFLPADYFAIERI